MDRIVLYIMSGLALSLMAVIMGLHQVNSTDVKTEGVAETKLVADMERDADTLDTETPMREVNPRFRSCF
ncbi:hypothetical protein BOO92_13675 [Vibrio navarrensis]|uniref:hypothetical protein n=1 Tax=Vibrio navarrensis TaxID=29495 RepID=UPI0018670D3C|nr:hypothetical protein [Vibrio navarrensis]MBE3657726.1 hypothetical protein [Vibrio navarrensis]